MNERIYTPQTVLTLFIYLFFGLAPYSNLVQLSWREDPPIRSGLEERAQDEESKHSKDSNDCLGCACVSSHFLPSLPLLLLNVVVIYIMNSAPTCTEF